MCIRDSDVPDEELIKRLLKRGKTSGRADDLDKNTIKNRLEVYKESTLPVFNHYMKKDCSVKIWGVGDMKLIAQRLALEIDSIKGVKRKKTTTKTTSKKVSTKKKASPKKTTTKKTNTKKKTTTSKSSVKQTVKKKSAPKKKSSKSKSSKSSKK